MRRYIPIALALSAALSLTACLSGARIPGMDISLPGSAAPKPVKGIKVAEIFGWHLRTAFLDSAGGSGPATAISTVRELGARWIGVPDNHTGQFSESYNYLDTVKDSVGGKIIRTLPTLHALSGGKPDFGAALYAYNGSGDRGPFIKMIIDRVQKPYTGIGLDMEESPYNKNAYPVTRADSAMASSGVLGDIIYNLSDRNEYAQFRALQIGLIYRIIITELEPEIAIGYSVSQPEIITTGEDVPGIKKGTKLTALEYHGVDWEFMFRKNVNWKGRRLRPLTRAMTGYLKGPRIPSDIVAWMREASFPILYNIQTFVPQLNQTEKLYTEKIEEILGLVNEGRGDGIAFVDFGPPFQKQVWGPEDDQIVGILIRLLKLYQVTIVA